MSRPPQLHQFDMTAKELGDIYKPVPRDLTGLPRRPPPPPYPWYTDPIPYELPYQRAVAGLLLDPTIGPLVEAHRSVSGEKTDEEQ